MDYNAKVIKIGSFTLILAIIADYGPPLYLAIFHGIMPPWSDLVGLYLIIAASFAASWIVQPVAYFPMLGMSGSYLCWLVGSVASVRMPASLMAQKIAKVEAGTPEGDVISTLAIAVSVLVSFSVITIFTFIGAQVMPLLPKQVLTSFNYILPTISAAIFANMTSQNLKLGLPILAIGTVAIMLLPLTPLGKEWYMMVFVILGIVWARLLFNYEMKKIQKSEQNHAQ